MTSAASVYLVEPRARGSREGDGLVAESQKTPPLAAPEPLRRAMPPAALYPADQLGPVLHAACESLSRVIQAPVPVCAGALLANSALAVQGLADVRHDERVYPLTLWITTWIDSGERKSSADREAGRAIFEYERELARAFEESAFAHEAQLEEWNAKREKARAEARKGGGIGLADALLGVGPAPERPLQPRRIIADFTLEGLAKYLADGCPSVGIFTDEAATVFGGHAMSREAAARTAAGLSKLWDGGTIDRVRSGDGASRLYGRRASLHLMGQPVIAESVFSDPLLSGQGFLARCLMSWPEPRAGTRLYRSESLRDDPGLALYHSTITSLLRVPLPIADGTRNELTPRTLTLSTEAAAQWRKLHDAVEINMRTGTRYAGAKPWASKTPEQCLRIAGVLTLVEDAAAHEINAETIERAAVLATWYLDEAARLVGVCETPAEVSDAEALLAWCHETGKTELYSKDAMNRGPNRLRTKKRFDAAMNELTRAGWAIPIDGGLEVDGAHRRRVWRILPSSEGR